MKTISIAMATYNGAVYISEQLECIAKQTLRPFEIVIVDDASSDKTLERIAAFAATVDFPVRVHKNEKNLGYRASFLKAAGLCSGDLIAFCDQDDVWMPNKLERCEKAFENEDVMLAYHNATVVDEKLNPIGDMAGRAAPRAVNPPNSMGAWLFASGYTQVFHRKLLQYSDYWHQSVDQYAPNQHNAHDQWFFFLAACLGTVVYIDDPLALYRRHHQTVTDWDYSTPYFSQLLALWASNISTVQYLGLAATSRIHILEQILKQAPDTLRQRINEAIKGYREQERICRSREQIYAEPAFAARVRLFTKSIKEGGYKSAKNWGAGRKNMIRDLLRGVIWPSAVNTLPITLLPQIKAKTRS